MIRPEELSPEELLAATGETPERVRVWREVHGPGRRRTGARFRDEVMVCPRCRNVTATRLLSGSECFGTTGRMIRRMDAMSPEAFRRWGHRMSDKQLKKLVPEPCNGLRMSPTAEIGYRWLEGTKIDV